MSKLQISLSGQRQQQEITKETYIGTGCGKKSCIFFLLENYVTTALSGWEKDTGETRESILCLKINHHNRSNTHTVNSLLATTLRKRPPPVSDHFVNNHFFFSVKYCFKNSLVSDHCLNFLRDRPQQFLGQKFDIFFCFLFPVGDPTRELLANHYSDVTDVQFSFSDFSVFVIEGFIRLKFRVISKYQIFKY